MSRIDHQHAVGELEHGSIGLREVVFQSITSMAPAGAIAFSIGLGAAFAGGSLPLALVLATVACVLTAVSVGQLAKQMPSAGSFFTYTSKALHPRIGFLAAWCYVLAVVLFMPALLLLVGAVGASFLTTETGLSAGYWWIWVVGGSLIVLAANYSGVQVATRLSLALGAFEILVFVALAISMFFTGGGHYSLSVFTTHFATVPGFTGISGVFAALVFSFLAFVGFEEAAPLAEEAVDPRRTIGRAVLLGAVAIGVLYVFVTFAATGYVGPGKLSGFQSLGDGNPYQAIARHLWGAGWVAVFLALVNSGLACANAGMAAATRTMFAMGRIRLLPNRLARVHPTRSTPTTALLLQFAVGLAVALFLGWKYSPLEGYAILGTLITVIVLVVYALTHVSSTAYYWRRRRTEFRVATHLVVPLVGIAMLVPALFAAAGVTAFNFISPLPAPISYAVPAAVSWTVAGVAYLSYLSLRDRRRIEGLTAVFGNEEADRGGGLVIHEPDVRAAPVAIPEA
jgi:amino acid transporter